MQRSARLGESVALGAVGVALGLAAVTVDPVGRVLVGVAAVVLLALALRDLALRPRLRTGPDGVTVRALTGSTTIAWPVLRVRVRVTRRLGIRSRTLELEDASDDGVLLVLGRHDLGEDPQAVAEALATGGSAAPATGGPATG